jgi:3-hydroxyisobutyrate dehydrogenase
MAKLAFLGTGLIGSGLAEAAAKRGDEVTVWNRSPEKARALEAFGAKAAAAPADAARGAARVHVVLTDDAAVDAVLEACGASLHGTVVVDHTTASPRGTVARAARLAERGVAFLHAPIFMSPKMCREAGGIILAAGPRPVFERVQAGLAAMTGAVKYLGERPDLAAANKLFGNAMILAVTAGLADVYAMAASLGIAAPDAHALFSTFNPAGTITYRGLAMAKGDFTPSFELTMARKDARLMLETADAAHPLHFLTAIAARMDTLLAQGHGQDDLGVLAVDAVPRQG